MIETHGLRCVQCYLMLGTNYHSIYTVLGALDLETLMEQTKYLMLLARVYQRVDRIQDAQEMFTKARDMQARCVRVCVCVCVCVC